MYNATEQFAEINKAGYDNAVKLAALSLEKAERLTKLNLQAAKVALEQGVHSANAVAGVKDVQEFFALRARGPADGLDALDAKGLDDGLDRHGGSVLKPE